MVNQDSSLKTFVQNIQLVRLRGRDMVEGAVEDGADASLWRRLKSWLPIGLVVFLPTFIAAAYFLLLAVPRYQSEAKFIVRMPGNGQASQIANMVQGTSIIRSVDDGYVVDAYMVSRDALSALVKDDGFRKMIARSGMDPLWRYPPLFMPDNEEKLYRYYKSFVSVSYDETTGISTVRAQAFRPQDAQLLVAALLKHSEELINRMSDRAEKDAVQVAERETEGAKQQAYAAARAMTDFRDREKVIDPTLVSNSVLKNITELALSSAETNAQLTELEASSPQSPQIDSLKSRIFALDQQIDKEREALAGTNGSLAPIISKYDILLLKQKFAEQAFTIALSALEQARVDARKQRVFLETITTPNLPDHPAYPYRLLSIFIVFAIAAMLYKIGRTFVADTAEHATR